ncbi:IucA/IucC family siderophore biosynthesis protein [Spiractinospora alimapuensis]|uniref:IucA/IucC family protein n=1 Tax=Spiractinospora alimapuensis TaxID=2820884 RepID=UPI001F1A1F50|nr:IucA/IucC family siderophore biosynthesis protein [Spiractinospora alimapuensis]QVQ50128.1 IucA/IucC family siderophore biosynthesis protein [Spiractinospora alimapuensis]
MSIRTAPDADLLGSTVHQATAHLTPRNWERANRHLVRKMLAEFAHERLVTPEAAAPGQYVLRGDDGVTEYRYAARVLALDHWSVDAASVTRVRGGSTEAPDAVDLVLDLREALGLSDDVLPVYLEEITATLAGYAYKLTRARPSAELAAADFQTIEAGMTEGHPCFVANNGRIGIDASEYHAYAPEAAPRMRLAWLAARRERCTVAVGAGVDHGELIRAELDEATRRRFLRRLTALGVDPVDYHLIPVHPWQWSNKLAVAFAGEVARQDLVYLGEGDDEYQPQQSVRTLFNVANPRRHYVKTAMSVLNMGFLRGLSAEYMRDTPAINDWVASVVSEDGFLRERGFSVLRERAAIGYHHRQYLAATGKGSPYRKMLAALWRESPLSFTRDGERLATMASLLHVDPEGRSVVGAYVAESGLEPGEWIRRYLDAYLVPVLHCFYAHDLVFMPHGENLVLVLRDGVPARVFMKDIGEEVGVLDPDAVLPSGVERIAIDVPAHLRTLSILTDVFDCFLRFLNAILCEEELLDEDTFWRTVAECVRDYQDSMPQLADRFVRDDLFAATFQLSCLNRLQLRDNRQMVDLDDPDPSASLQFHGELTNPIARFVR